jgi:hypothetical protein
LGPAAHASHRMGMDLTLHDACSRSAASTTFVATLRREDEQPCTVFAARLSFGGAAGRDGKVAYEATILPR